MTTVYDMYREAVHADLANFDDPASSRLRDRFTKKLNPLGNLTAGPSAITDFLDSIDRLNNFDLSVDKDIISNMRDFCHHVFMKGARRVCDMYGFDDYPQQTFVEEVLSHPDFLRFGHGSNATSSKTYILDKLDSGELSCTSACEKLLDKLYELSPDLHKEVRSAERFQIVEYSKIVTVPKNEEKARVIACEPTINLWFQLAIGRFIEESLRSIGLNIQNQQDFNKILARKGSLDENQLSDTCPCTLDLSSASDSISIELCRLVLPDDIFNIMMTTRSTFSKIAGCSDLIELPMMSTMGNGFTFPLLTLLCTAFCYASDCIVNKRGRRNFINWSLFAVFGDDIIVPRSHIETICDIITKCGFLINHQKSYSIGLFRESCGGDYYNGEFITPVYVGSLESQEDILIAINKVLDWSSRHKPLNCTLQMLASLLDDKHRILVPDGFQYNQGIIFPSRHVSQRIVDYIDYTTLAASLHLRRQSLLLFAILGSFIASAAYVSSRNKNKPSIAFAKLGEFYTSRECKRVAVRRKTVWPFLWNSKPKSEYNVFQRVKGEAYDPTEGSSSYTSRQARRCNQIWLCDALSSLANKLMD